MNLLTTLENLHLSDKVQMNLIVNEVSKSSEMWGEVWEVLGDRDLGIKAANLIKKTVRKHPDLLKSKQDALLNYLTKNNPPHPILLNLVPLFEFVKVSQNKCEEITEYLLQLLDTTSNKFLKVECVQALTNLALKHDYLKESVKIIVNEEMEKGTASMKARCRKLLKTLD